MRKILVLLLVLLLSITAISENHIYYYEMKDTVIAGTLKMEEIHDPPGYNKGEIIYPYILYLAAKKVKGKECKFDSGIWCNKNSAEIWFFKNGFEKLQR